MARYIRTTLRFSLETYRELRCEASRRGMTFASLVRESVERYLGRGVAGELVPFGDDPADALVGSFITAAGDESVNHDHYLYGWPNEKPRSSIPKS